jgi:hypothetical protein
MSHASRMACNHPPCFAPRSKIARVRSTSSSAGALWPLVQRSSPTESAVAGFLECVSLWPRPLSSTGARRPLAVLARRSRHAHRAEWWPRDSRPRSHSPRNASSGGLRLMASARESATCVHEPRAGDRARWWTLALDRARTGGPGRRMGRRDQQRCGEQGHRLALTSGCGRGDRRVGELLADPKRGTDVSVHFQYAPPAGQAGAFFATVFGGEPSQTIREDLRRLKQVLESGEIPRTSTGEPRL